MPTKVSRDLHFSFQLLEALLLSTLALSHNSDFRQLPHQLSTSIISTMSVTDETKAVAPEAATIPAEAEPTKEVEKAAADAPVEEKKEEETKVSLSRRRVQSRSKPCAPSLFFCIIVQPLGLPWKILIKDGHALQQPSPSCHASNIHRALHYLVVT